MKYNNKQDYLIHEDKHLRVDGSNIAYLISSITMIVNSMLFISLLYKDYKNNNLTDTLSMLYILVIILAIIAASVTFEAFRRSRG